MLVLKYLKYEIYTKSIFKGNHDKIAHKKTQQHLDCTTKTQHNRTTQIKTQQTLNIN